MESRWWGLVFLGFLVCLVFKDARKMGDKKGKGEKRTILHITLFDLFQHFRPNPCMTLLIQFHAFRFDLHNLRNAFSLIL